MLKRRGASNTAALRFSPQATQRWANFVERSQASRSAVESFSELTAMAPAQVGCARFPFLVLKEPEEDALKRIKGAEQLAAWAAGKSLWTRYPREQTEVKREQTDRPFHEQAFGSGQFRAVLRSAVAGGSEEAERAIGCEPFLF